MSSAGAAVLAFVIAYFLSVRAAHRGIEGATRDLDGAPLGEPGEFAMRQTRQDVAAIVGLLVLTNALLAAIAAALIF